MHSCGKLLQNPAPKPFFTGVLPDPCSLFLLDTILVPGMCFGSAPAILGLSSSLDCEIFESRALPYSFPSSQDLTQDLALGRCSLIICQVEFPANGVETRSSARKTNIEHLSYAKPAVGVYI